jgi:hypothetical protein
MTQLQIADITIDDIRSSRKTFDKLDKGKNRKRKAG